MSFVQHVLYFILFISPQTQTNVISFDKVIEEKLQDDLPVEMQQNQPTSDAVPAVFDGSNLNLVVENIPSKAKIRNFRATPLPRLLENENTERTKLNANKNIISTLNEKITLDEKYVKPFPSPVEEEIIKPDKIVQENCIETIIREHQLLKAINQYKDKQYTQDDAVNKRETYTVISTEETMPKLDSAKSQERKQTKQEMNSKKVTQLELEPIPSTNGTTTEMTILSDVIIHITTEKTLVTILSTDKDTTNNNTLIGRTEDWFDFNRKDKPKIRFGGGPQRDAYLIPTLGLDEGFYPFRFMSEFFAFIYPFQYPVGLVKEIFSGQFSFPYSFLYAIKVESAFFIIIITFLCFSLVIPAYLLVVTILSLLSKMDDEDSETGALFPETNQSKCNDTALVFTTLFLVMLSCLFLSGMAVSNEQATGTVEATRNAFSCACTDLATWVSAAARELLQSLVPSVDMVVQAFREDLRNIEPLLGEPIQKTIASESGIDLVLESLQDVVEETDELSAKISSLRDISMQAGAIATAASDRIKDLGRQLENLKMHCFGKDVKLCDTIKVSSLELQIKFDLVLQENHLMELRSLGAENLTYALTNIKSRFHKLPSSVSAQTSPIRQSILANIDIRRDNIYKSSRVLADIVRELNIALHTAVRTFETEFDKFQYYDTWRWYSMIGSIAFIAVAILLVLSGIVCGCSSAKSHGRRTLIMSAMWTSIASIWLWILVTGVFLIAGHAEVYICHALWDSPQYVMLSQLLDRPSPLLENHAGVFDALFKDLENVTINVSIRDVLRDCEKNYPAYNVFHLQNVLDVNKATSYFEWQDLQDNFSKLSKALDIGFLKTISADLSRILSEMLVVSNVDLAKYRLQYNGPVVGKDLLSLAEQLQNVAAQVTDLSTSTRFETLASRTQRLYATNIKPLEQFRADIVFKLTELELQLMPFRRKLNISLSHIHTAQFYIDNQGDVIAQKKVSAYVERLVSHVAGWRTHVLASAALHAARCRPLYTVFDAARTVICSRYIASLHGWWVCGVLLGVTWCGLTPLTVSLWRTYQRKLRSGDIINLNHIGASAQETPTTAVCENSNWNTPCPPPPRNDSW